MSNKHHYDCSNLHEDIEILVAHDYEVHEFSEYHYRINGRLDVWPTARKAWKKGWSKSVVYHPTPLVEFVMEELPHPCPKI